MESKEIRYNEEKKEIQFIGKITSFKFYTLLFSALKEHYKINGKEAIPIFSFVFVDEFDALVIPNIISIGLIIKRFHQGKRIPLKLLNTSATYFLDSINFFKHVGEKDFIGETIIENGFEKNISKKIGLDIFEFEKGYLGFYNNVGIQKSLNPNHKIQIFDNCSFEYYKNYSDEEIPPDKLEKVLDTIRTKKFNELKPKVKKYFYKTIHYKHREKDDVDSIISILTEIISNSILYSDSHCFAMLQSKDDKTKISISDIGIGLKGSLKYKPNFDFHISKTYKGDHKEKLKNYLLIFDALQYSMSKHRENLFSLLKLIIKKGGKMRIHYDDVQVVFTTNRCGNCDIIPEKCYKCLLNNLSNDKLISPIRFFDWTFKGMHIEVELDF